MKPPCLHWMHLLLSCGLTAGLFILLPLANTQEKVAWTTETEAIPLESLIFREPPRPEPNVREILESEAVEWTPPELNLKPVPVEIPVEMLDLTLARLDPDLAGDFQVQFNVQAITPTSVDLFKVEDLDTQPVLTHPVQPTYPNLARRRKIAGRVLVQFVLEVDGSITSPTVIARPAEAGKIFDATCLRAVRQWKFNGPGRRNGEPVRTLYQVPFQFGLERR